MLTDLTSTLGADRPLHDISLFPRLWETRPTKQHRGLTATELIEVIAPASGPVVSEVKLQAPFFVSSLLRDAPYVYKTAQRFPGQSGPQRSGGHVIAGSSLVLDVDHASTEAAEAMRDRLAASDVLYVAYSTHSHGKYAGEVSMRIVVFLDQPLEPRRYIQAWSVANTVICQGTADPKARHLYQAQGVWATPRARVGEAFRHRGGARLLSTQAVLAQAQDVEPTRPRSCDAPRAQPQEVSPSGVFVPSQGVPPAWRERQLIAAVIELGPLDDYAVWIAVLAGIRGAVDLGEVDEQTGRALWLEASSWASDTSQQMNTDERYDPEHLWERAFSVPAQARVGGLFKRARDHALGVVTQELQGPRLSTQGRASCDYLATYHHKAINTLIKNPPTAAETAGAD